MLKEGDLVPSGLAGTLVVKTPEGFEDKEISLDNLLKNQTIVLYFYPKDNTPGCTTEALAFQNYLQEFKKLNVRIVGCSRDNFKSHSSFMEKKSLEFDLLSDVSGKITEAFGVWAEKSMYGKKFMGILRSSFVIENCKIIKVYPKVSVKDHAMETLEYLASRE